MKKCYDCSWFVCDTLLMLLNYSYGDMTVHSKWSSLWRQRTMLRWWDTFEYLCTMPMYYAYVLCLCTIPMYYAYVLYLNILGNVYCIFTLLVNLLLIVIKQYYRDKNGFIKLTKAISMVFINCRISLVCNLWNRHDWRVCCTQLNVM